ncbi:DUF4124 domain-containing protein [Pseudomonadota bacterium]
MRIIQPLLFALILTPVAAIAGEVHRCKDPNGYITYTQAPCPENTEQAVIKTDVPPNQTPDGGLRPGEIEALKQFNQDKERKQQEKAERQRAKEERRRKQNEDISEALQEVELQRKEAELQRKLQEQENRMREIEHRMREQELERILR